MIVIQLLVIRRTLDQKMQRYSGVRNSQKSPSPTPFKSQWELLSNNPPVTPKSPGVQFSFQGWSSIPKWMYQLGNEAAATACGGAVIVVHGLNMLWLKPAGTIFPSSFLTVVFYASPTTTAHIAVFYERLRR